MIQFNLLPDIKLEYIKARRTKQTVILLSFIISGAALALFVLFFMVVNVVQKQHLGNLDEDIKSGKGELQQKTDLAKILTVQNQLNSLPSIHDQKPVTSRTFGFIQQVTPQKASVSSLKVNFTDQTMEITGSADSLVTVNTFVDTLKFTTFSTSAKGEETTTDKQEGLAFSSVVLSTFSVTSAQTGTDQNKAISYTIKLKYDPVIFTGDKDVSLVVTSKVTTRSETEKPSAIFQADIKPTVEGEQ